MHTHDTTNADKAGFTLACSRFLQIITQGLVILVMISMAKPEFQGYYYTIQGMLAFSTIFDVGIALVLTQVCAHESASLKDGIRSFQSEDYAIYKQASDIIVTTLKYIPAACIVYLAIMLGAAHLVDTKIAFSSAALQSKVAFVYTLSVALTATSIFNNAIYSIIEGFGDIKWTYQVRLFCNIGASIALIAGLLLGADLYVIPASLAWNSIVPLAIASRRYGRTFYDLITAQPEPPKARRTNWIHIHASFLAKVAMSSISGYLLLYFATPILLSRLGPTEAGKYGLGVQIVNGCMVLSMSWVNARQAIWGKLVANRNHSALRSDFLMGTKRVATIYIALSSAIILSCLAIQHFSLHKIQAMVNSPALFTMLTSGFLNLLLTAQSLYLRSHKIDPFIWPSIAGSIINIAIVLTLAQHGLLVYVLGCLGNTLVIGIGWSNYIFFKIWRHHHETR